MSYAQPGDLFSHADKRGRHEPSNKQVCENLCEKVWNNLKCLKRCAFQCIQTALKFENGVLRRAKKSEIRLKSELSHLWISYQETGRPLLTASSLSTPLSATTGGSMHHGGETYRLNCQSKTLMSYDYKQKYGSVAGYNKYWPHPLFQPHYQPLLEGACTTEEKLTAWAVNQRYV